MQCYHGGYQDPAHHVGVAVEVLGGGVQHQVGSETERLLEDRTREGVVDREEESPRLTDVADRLATSKCYI